MPRTRLPLVPMLLALAAVVAGTGAYAAWLGASARPAFHGTTYDPVAPAADFRLVDQDGRAATLAGYRGRPVLVFFGYTRCTDFCPLTLDRLSRAVRELGPKAGGARILLVTVDPANDTPAALKRYVARFAGRVEGLTGDSAALAAAWRAYSVYIAPGAPAPAAAAHGHHPSLPAALPPALAHSGVVYGIDRRGDLRVVISDGATDEETKDDIRALARL
jgi:protein SCO1/2